MWITEDDTDILLEVLEIHADGRLLVQSAHGQPFFIHPSNPAGVILLTDNTDPINRIFAMQSLGYEPVPFYIEGATSSGMPRMSGTL